MNRLPGFGSDPCTNELLAALPDGTLNRWMPHLRDVELECGQLLGWAGTAAAHVFFPSTAIVSLLCITPDGACAEVGVVGNDGVVGMSEVLGGDGLPSQCVVQSSGRGYQLPARVVMDEINRGGAVLNIMLRYGHTLFAQVAQTALCNRYHSIDQQVCRRLLVSLDRSPSDQLTMTHSAMANLLGVRREGISAAASKLQQAGIIHYNRGQVVIQDREALEQRACECYSIARTEADKLRTFSGTARTPASPPGLWALGRMSTAADRFLNFGHGG